MRVGHALLLVGLLGSAASGRAADKPVASGAKASSHAGGAKGAAAEPVEVKSDPPPAAQSDGAGVLDEPRKVAEAYLNALAGKGSEESKSFLLGGVTLTAQDFTIPNWRIAARDAARVEEKPVGDALKAMRAVDKVGSDALSQVAVKEGENLVLDQEQAARVLGPTRAAAARFQQDFPLFAYVARVDKDVFWHPENPWRKEALKLGDEGTYHLELQRFMIEEQVQGKVTRTWPLRVLRVKTRAYDSGWKILPASNWDPNY